MLRQYRFRGINTQGRIVQGTFNVRSVKEAKLYISKLIRKYNLKIEVLEKQVSFLYTIYIPGKKPIRKYQSAYSKDEVIAVLTKMGYKNYRVRRIWFDLRLKPSRQDILLFIQLSTNMLKDNMSFGNVLEMLADEQTNRTLRDTLITIENQLKSGEDGSDVFNQHAHILGRFTAYMLGLATRSGRMVEVFEATAKFIQREYEIRKSIKRALVTPLFAVLATIGAVIYYVQEIFPSTVQLFLNYGMKLPSMTQTTLEFSNWLQYYGLFILAGVIGLLIVYWRWKNTKMGRYWSDANIVKLPIVGHLIHKTSIEMFFWVFATINTGSGDNIDTIRISSEACRNTWMEKKIKTITIPLMLQQGEAFVTAMDASGVFTRTSITRLKTGQESWNVILAAKQIAKFYESETTHKLAIVVEFIQLFIALFIAVVITLLTLISAEIATIQPPTSF